MSSKERFLEKQFMDGCRLISVVAALCGLGLSCKPSGFLGVSPDKRTPYIPPKQVDTVATGSILLSCDPQSLTVIRGNTNVMGVPVSFQSSCSDSVVTSDFVSAKRPVDIVFVLDVTKSMQPNIDAVKANVVDFAKRIGSKGWDARFSGVAYRDPPGSTPGHIGDPMYELLYSTDFMDDSALENEISSGKPEWIADDKSDNQEGGQAAISKALDILTSSRRPDADGVILFVTDAPSFAGNDHWNFTVDSLANKMAVVPKLKFYHSTLATFEGSPDALKKYGNLSSNILWVGDKSYNIARNQMEALRLAAGKQGAWVEFPLRQSTFVDTLPAQFETVTNTVPVDCRVSEAKILGPTGAVVLLYSGGAAAGKGTLSFQSGIMSPGTYTYQEKRCCVRTDAMPQTCEKTRDRQSSLTIR